MNAIHELRTYWKVGCVVFVPLLFVLLAGCQPKVYLMPSPIGLQPDSNFYNLTQDNKDENRLTTLYATNRIPNTLSARKSRYTIFPSDDLYFGLVTHRVGEDGETWEDLYQKSLSQERGEKHLLSIHKIEELFSIESNTPLESASLGKEELFANLNLALERTADKDITIYVHGANSNFYRATAQGAQYFHYTGHNSIVLTFSWPSAENIFEYKVDVLHAKKTVPAFAKVIELLAHHTTARHINIIAYSAGAQVAAPALVYLRKKYPEEKASFLKKRFRLGEIYFAAPDIEIESFAYRLKILKDIVKRITISSNMSDDVLLYAGRHAGKSRLGRPDGAELSAEEKEIFIQFSKTLNLDIIDIDGSKPLQVGTSHSFWYSHPWVSNDLLLLMLLNLPPAERGLVSYKDDTGLEIYRFPDNYQARIKRLKEILKSQ